jgi:cytidylate kinase
MSAPLVIAIDGPSGSGKSSVARGVALSLGLDYLDTGGMYRAMTWFVLSQGVDVADVEAVAQLAVDAQLRPSVTPEMQDIYVGDTDVTEIIRGELITSLVSKVAAIPAVRSLLVARQQELVTQASAGIVVEGRDIGTVVLPNAFLKLYITADPSIRASRRAAESAGDVAATQDSLLARDHADATRQVSPLELADDAILLDTTHMNLPEVIEHVLALVAERS